MKDLCFYHGSDLDGKCSAALVKVINNTCKLIPIEYGDEFPWDVVSGRETVIMVDFSLQPFEKMVKLYNICGDNLIWIDHHISAIKAHEEWIQENKPLEINGIREVGIGACYLVWKYFFEHNPPLFVELIAKYDVWDHSDPRTLPFQYGMRARNTNPNDTVFWKFQMRNPSVISRIIEEGEAILKYIEQENLKYVEGTAFETVLDGFKCIAVNKAFANSSTFDSVDTSAYDIMMTFAWYKDKWQVSLYTSRGDLDVSEIAKRYGGGGHKGAAGFTCSRLPFQLPRKA